MSRHVRVHLFPWTYGPRILTKVTLPSHERTTRINTVPVFVKVIALHKHVTEGDKNEALFNFSLFCNIWVV